MLFEQRDIAIVTTNQRSPFVRADDPPRKARRSPKLSKANCEGDAIKSNRGDRSKVRRRSSVGSCRKNHAAVIMITAQAPDNAIAKRCIMVDLTQNCI